MQVSVNMSADTFLNNNKIFEKYKGRKTALYGLGTETQRTLAVLGNEYEIAGLLDSFRTDGELYGRRILSLDAAIRAGVGLIIVVARPGSCRAIRQQIGKKCRDSGIALLDIRGKDLLEEKKVSYCFTSTDGITKAELEKKIRNADVVSFDLFDTLVMRQTLYAGDVPEYVDCRLKEKGVCIEDFCRKRLAAEKELSQNKAPTLTEIYQNVLEKPGTAALGITAGQLAGMEWKTDSDLLVPRKEVCRLLTETARLGKKVYIVSDTYYSREQLARILEKCEITEYTDILASSDYGTGKTQGLYKILKAKENPGRYLHIGDDIVADVQSAGLFGFEICRLPSGLDLLESLGGLGLQNCLVSLSDRLKAGMFVARIFNSPFRTEDGNRHLKISAAYDIGYLLCAPVFSDFVLWFHDHMQREGFQNIWFSARDGYLIRKMYTYLTGIQGQKEQTVYFLASRTAAIRAGMREPEDIRYVDEMQYSGTLEEKLSERFGINAGSIKSDRLPATENGLMRYQMPILEKARTMSGNYQKYIEKLNVKNGPVAFFDFVAKGTTQMYLQRLVSNRLKGFYFLQLEKAHMKGKKLDIRAFYEDGETDSCVIYNDYYILETLLTAPHPSVLEFDSTGEPVYAVETRSDRNIACFMQAQDGIFDYFRSYIALCPQTERTVNRRLDEIFLELVHKVKITDRDFLELMVEDVFFNRMTRITDIL